MIKHIIFDLWGTLAQSDRTKLPFERWILMKYARETWFQKGGDDENGIKSFADEKHLDFETLWKAYQEMEASAQLFKGMQELIEQLHEEGFKIHLLSNSGQSAHHFVDSHAEFFKHFDTIQFSYQIGYVKPDHRIFRTCLEAIGARPEECIMVGDSQEADIVPAKALGMHTIYFEGDKKPISQLRQDIFGIIEKTTKPIKRE